jgi:hypothetical protein
MAVRTCNPPPVGPSKTRNQSPLGRFQHDHQQGRDYISAMPSRRSSTKDSPAKLAKRMKRRWRIVLMHSKGELLGYVDATDAQAAEAVAAEQFQLDG